MEWWVYALRVAVINACIRVRITLAVPWPVETAINST